MDNSVISDGFAPLLVYGNWFQFSPGERIAHEKVESVMLLWCRSGRGNVIANTKTFQLPADRLLILPWNHSIEYRADQTKPFLVAGLHLIPRHQRTSEIVFNVAHGSHGPMYSRGERQPITDPEFQTPSIHDLSEMRGTHHLIEYAVLAFSQMRDTVPDQMWLLGQILLFEIKKLFHDRKTKRELFPAALKRLVIFIEDHLHEKITTNTLMEISDKSPSTLHRLFREHFNQSPMSYINLQRVNRGAELLRTTNMQVFDVAMQCGYEDPFYFSRCFKNQMGKSPLQYRQATRGI